MTATAGCISVGLYEQGSRHVYLPLSGTINVEWHQIYKVQMADWNSYSALQVAQAVDPAGNAIPTLGSAYSSLICMDVTPTQVEQSALWEVQVVYKNFSVPTAQVVFGSQKYSVECNADVNGKAVINSAGNAYTPKLKRDFYLPTMCISWEQTATPAIGTITGAVGSVNSDTPSITIAGMAQSFAVRTLKLQHAPVKLKYSNNAPLWSIELNFIYAPQNWDVKAVDEGFFTNVPKFNTPILDNNGKPVQTIQLLNGSGAVLAAGGTPVINPFQMDTQTVHQTLFNMVP